MRWPKRSDRRCAADDRSKASPGWACAASGSCWRKGAPLDVDAIVLACSGASAARLLSGIEPTVMHALAPEPRVPIVKVALGFTEAAVRGRVKGPGFVVPRRQGLRMLGCEWTSNLLPHRAPEGSALLTVRFGGPADPSANALDDEALTQLALSELRVAMGIVAEPTLRHVRRDDLAGSFTVGHLRRWERISRAVEERPGLALIGDDLRADATVSPYAKAPAIAERLVDHVAGRQFAAAR